jgi:hypothetical protein
VQSTHHDVLSGLDVERMGKLAASLHWDESSVIRHMFLSSLFGTRGTGARSMAAWPFIKLM